MECTVGKQYLKELSREDEEPESVPEVESSKQDTTEVSAKDPQQNVKVDMTR